MKKLITIAVAAFTSIAVVSVFRVAGMSAVPVVVSGCLGDACDEARDKCHDRGMEARNCDKDTSLFYQECECECVDE